MNASINGRKMQTNQAISHSISHAITLIPPTTHTVHKKTRNRNLLEELKEKIQSFTYYFDALVRSIEKLGFFETDFEIVPLQVLYPYGHSILRSA